MNLYFRATCQKFYEHFSIMRDPELLDVITKYICGIEQYKFNLALVLCPPFSLNPFSAR